MKVGAIVVVLALGAGTASAQSLGEVARRERERRGALEQHSPVLTNEDFQRRKILEPVRETVPQTVTVVSEPTSEATAVAPVPVSLGEYARRLREQRAARQKEERAAIAPPPAVPQRVPAPQIPIFAPDSVRVHDTAGRPVSLGEYARRVREERQSRESAPQVAVNQPVPAPSVETPRVSLEEYARRLQEARKPKPLAVDADVSAAVVGVQRGDTLWKLSAFYLGRGDLWTSLWKANPQLSNPNLIRPGQLLRLPDTPQMARQGPSRLGNAATAALSSEFAADGATPNLRDAPLLIAGSLPPRVNAAGFP